MRHLVEVMLVLEGEQQWARAVREIRRRRKWKQEPPPPLPPPLLLLPLPLSSVSFVDGKSGDHALCGLLRVMVEGPLDKEMVRTIVSFI